MVTLTAKELTVNDVHQLLKWDRKNNESMSSLLALEPLTEFEQEELSQISQDFNEYLSTSKVSEGLVKALTTYPLMRLAGFYHSPIKISLEENIAPINIEGEETIITGRMDIMGNSYQEYINLNFTYA